jgi:hypothetical protein
MEAEPEKLSPSGKAEVVFIFVIFLLISLPKIK